MNKYVIIIVILALIIGGGAFYRAKFVPDIEKEVVTGIDRKITITIFEDTWTFTPEEIDADKGDKIILTIINNDEYDHGFAVDAYGVSQRLPAKQTTRVEFVASKPGDFPYYCSVSCGSGLVDGKKRGHFDQVGKLRVAGFITETSGLAPISSDEDFSKEARQSSIISSANGEAEKRGYDLEIFSVVFDEENKLWSAFLLDGEAVYELSEGENFQAVLYQDDELKPALWVLVNTTDGSIQDVIEVN